MKSPVLISEVGPRDGLQSIQTVMATDDKKTWIRLQAEAGFKEIEVGSFVPAKLLPQLADTAEITEYARTIPNLTVAVLVPNLYGAREAVNCGAHKITLPLSLSETHSKKNLNRTHAQMLTEISNIRELLESSDKAPNFEVGLSTAFGCTLEGTVAEDFVVDMAEKVIELGADEVGLSDTTGYANPTQVARLTKRVRERVGDDKLTGIHLHNTRGQGLANVVAALDAGLTTFDSSLGGLGGCPFAPGASGNIVTEDLVFLLESMGHPTGVNIDALLETRRFVASALPQESFYGFTTDAGLPKTFRYAVDT